MSTSNPSIVQEKAEQDRVTRFVNGGDGVLLTNAVGDQSWAVRMLGDAAKELGMRLFIHQQYIEQLINEDGELSDAVLSAIEYTESGKKALLICEMEGLLDSGSLSSRALLEEAVNVEISDSLTIIVLTPYDEGDIIDLIDDTAPAMRIVWMYDDYTERDRISTRLRGYDWRVRPITDEGMARIDLALALYELQVARKANLAGKLGMSGLAYVPSDDEILNMEEALDSLLQDYSHELEAAVIY